MRLLTLTEEGAAENLALIERYGDTIEGVEIRLDLLVGGGEAPAEAARRLLSELRRRGLRSVLTCRRRADGGSWQGDEDSRAALLERALQPGCDYLDLEEEPPLPRGALSRLYRRATEHRIGVIGSLHSFDGLPQEWPERMRSVAARGRVPKLAAKVGSFAEAADVYRAAARLHLPGPRILLLMGPYGFFSRILYRRFGSMCTFLSAPERRALPWHPDPQQFTRLYRADRIDEATPLYGVIGDPVHHSRSPQLHNQWLQRAGLPGSYLPFQVERAEPFFRFAAEAGVLGFSVTLPLKEEVLPQLDAYSAEVEHIGACNTVVRRGNAWYGYNTDLHGFLAPLDAHDPGSLSGRVLVIGAGGVARTVAAALAARRVPWVCVNRTAEKARALALEFGGSWLPRESADEGGPYRLVVQTSSAGMEPETEADPLPHYRFTGGETVYELIYAPEETVLLRRARLAGCRTLGGAAMLRAQAERQFHLFTGRAVPQARRGE